MIGTNAITKPVKQGIKFGVSFIVTAATLTALAAYLPTAFLNWWLSVTIVTTTLLGQLLGMTITTVGEIMTVNGFAMRIITQCTALHYVIILSTAILFYTSHTILYRLTGLLIGIPLIIMANAFRLVVTGVTGSISWNAFIIVHDYLWVAAFSLMILAIWIIWNEQRFFLTKGIVKRGSIVVLTCTAAYGLLFLAMPLYGKLMALITEPLFKALISDSSAGVTFTGGRILYTYTGGTFSANFAPDLMVVSLYLGLIISAGNYTRAAVKKGILGLVIILSASVVIIAGGGALSVTSGKNAAVVFLWTAHGLMLQLTLLWWILKVARTEHASIKL